MGDYRFISAIALWGTGWGTDIKPHEVTIIDSTIYKIQN